MPHDPAHDEGHAALSAFAATALETIRDPCLGVNPLLPEDARPLAERATALYDWVRGFLFALGIQGIAERDLSGQTREILHDFIDLTRLDLDALDDHEENEEALTELIEFIRVSAMWIYEERANVRDVQDESRG